MISDQYKIIVNGKTYPGPELQIHITEETKITCEATNVMGTGRITITVHGDGETGKFN